MNNSKQIIFIWQELDYLRSLLGKVLGKISESNLSLKEYIDEDLFNDCRMYAKLKSSQRFPE